MEIKNANIDAGKAFDWGRTSADYAKYRDIYPDKFYQKLIQRNLFTEGQTVLDLGTGTGVLPRNLYRYGAKWIGTDISENQIAEAKRIASELDMDIDFYTIASEEIDFPDSSFDVITACQCFWYFDHAKLTPKLAKMLKPNGRLLILYMAWLPYEDKIAGASEDLVLQYSPQWSGAGEVKKPIHIPDAVYNHFELVSHEEYDLAVSFTRDTWHGRMRACRGVGASLKEDELERWDKEHRKLLSETAPEKFEILHYAAIAELKKR
ncbi:MAG: methyltransferase domain-containing protein [Clostridia bacterium]|nr:methyltransferase domain-containing protein [Clostridia bacterium]